MKANEKQFLQCPVRNESVAGVHVYSHSGEYSPQATDFRLPARGISFQFIRKYRSATRQLLGPMGRGWTSTYAKTLVKEGDDVLYHDGLGRIHRFKSIPSKKSYLSPDGLYTRLEATRDTFFIRQRHGGVLIFEKPERGGRLLAIEDRNGNCLRFNYNKNAVQIFDPLGRRIDVHLDKERIVKVSHADRVWQYLYNDDGCLVEVIQPPTDDAPKGPRTRYAYDEAFRLTSITNPNGQVFLRNCYDDCDRVSQQKHGNGTFKFEYETIGETDSGLPIYRTQVWLKNGALFFLKHDAFGHAIERTLLVSAEFLSPEDRGGSSGTMVPVITKSIFNRHGELARRENPAGDVIEQIYDEKSVDPRARGNLLKLHRTPAAGIDTDQTKLITRYCYEPRHQQLESLTDPRGHVTRFKYDDRGNLAKKSYPAVTIPKIGNKKAKGKKTVKRTILVENSEYNHAGQLIRFTNPRGATVEYFYHRVAHPGGTKAHADPRSYTQKAGGYLARIVRDTGRKERRVKSKPARVTVDYLYDSFGNRTTILDGKGNPTRFKYDAHNRVIETTSRKPFGHKKGFRYDANGNLREATYSFDHHQYDPVAGTILRKSTQVCQSFEYNSLNNPVRRTIASDGREVTNTLVRDANENIVRRILPMGNAFEYEYDERNRVIVRRSGAQTRDESEIRHTYTLNGRPRSTVDGGGNTVRYDYDGFHRYKGLKNASGTVRRHRLDEVGNVTRLQVRGNSVSMHTRGKSTAEKMVVLLESLFQYDELNRRVQTSRVWTDPLSGEALGKTQLDGEKATVSTVIEYDNNNLPSKIFGETGNVLHLQYDGVNRTVSASDETGESVSIEYDENSNPVCIERLGPAIKGDKKRFRQITNHQFDELDRLITRSINGGAPETFAYNSLNLITEHKNEAKVPTKYLHDSLGRFSGRATTAIVPPSTSDGQSKQLLVQRVEWNDNNRLTARVNAANHSTRYNYDGLDRLSSIVYPDGAARCFERDANGNIIRLTGSNRNIITNRFDAQNRLFERIIEGVNADRPQIERFQYDGLNRLVFAQTDSAAILRRYDSLSRLLEESQSGRAIKYEYDSAGNCVRLLYPGGLEICKSYDSLRRVTEVLDGRSYLIASYRYGSGTQVREQQLGNVLKAAYTYEPGKDWLNSVIYRSIDKGEIIEGSKCRYDATGNRIEEVQLRRGGNFGDRYFYDSANRIVKAQYGIKRLNDSDSSFEREVLYELSPAGLWQLKTTRDRNGNTLEEDKGTTNEREAYLSLGSRQFSYDANGNRVLQENGENNEDSKKQYSYDYANRLVRVESIDANGRPAQTIEYAYDTFNRQILKRIGNESGTIEIGRIWDGDRLIEEWEGDRLARSFIYGPQSKDRLMMNLHTRDAVEKFFYSSDARGAVTALVNSNAALVEQYCYDVLGRPSLVGKAELDPNELEDSLPVSSIGNPLFADAQIWDGHAGIYFSHQMALDVVTDQFLNQANNLPGLRTPNSNLMGTISNPATYALGGPQLLSTRGYSETGSGFPKGTAQSLGALGAIVTAVGVGAVIIGAATGPGELAVAPAGIAVAGVGVLISGTAALIGYVEAIGEDTSLEPEEAIKVGPFRVPDDSGDSHSGGAGHGGSGGGGGGIGIGGRGGVDGGYGGASGTGGDSSLPDDDGPPPPTVEVEEGDIEFTRPDGSTVTQHPDGSLEYTPGGGATPGGDIGSGSGGFGSSGGDSSGGDSSGGDSGSGTPGGGCFIAGTPVLLAGGATTPIEAVEVGDYVISRDETTGNTSAQRVLRMWIHKVKETLLLHLKNGEQVETTKEHRFYEANKGFVGAGRLLPGATLRTQSEQSVELSGMAPKKQPATVYNLEIENFHTYFVGKNGVWVHNLKIGDPDLPDPWDKDP